MHLLWTASNQDRFASPATMNAATVTMTAVQGISFDGDGVICTALPTSRRAPVADSEQRCRRPGPDPALLEARANLCGGQLRVADQGCGAGDERCRKAGSSGAAGLCPLLRHRAEQRGGGRRNGRERAGDRGRIHSALSLTPETATTFGNLTASCPGYVTGLAFA
jgi:hypothetical protein